MQNKKDGALCSSNLESCVRYSVWLCFRGIYSLAPGVGVVVPSHLYTPNEQGCTQSILFVFRTYLYAIKTYKHSICGNERIGISCNALNQDYQLNFFFVC